MAGVMHFFAPDDSDSDRVACGLRALFCEDYTDERRYVECKRCRRTKMFTDYDPTRFDVDAWDHEGDIVDHLQRVTFDEAQEFKERYADNPMIDVVVNEIPS